MPCASELKLPQLAFDEPANSSTGSVEVSGARKRAARLSTLSTDMSVFSNDDVESTFSSLLRSVAGREEGYIQELRSVEGGQIPSEEPQDVLSDKSYVVVSDPSGSANVDANEAMCDYLAGPRHTSTSRPKSILPVLDESDDPVKQQNTQTWVQSQLAHLQPAARIGEAGSSIPPLDTREPAVSGCLSETSSLSACPMLISPLRANDHQRTEPVDPFRKQEKTIQAPWTNTTESLCIQSNDASLSIDATALTIGSLALASIALEESWRTIVTEPLIEDANLDAGGSDSEHEPGEDLRIALPATSSAEKPALRHELAKRFFGLWLPILSLFAAVAASYFSHFSALLGLNFFRFWSPTATLTPARLECDEQSKAATPPNNADNTEESPAATASLPSFEARTHERLGDPVQQHVEDIPLPPVDLLSLSPSRTPTATRTISSVPSSSVEAFVQEHIYPAALACGLFLLFWLAQQASSRIFHPAQRKRKYVVYKRPRPNPNAASTLPKSALASQSRGVQADETRSTPVDTPSSIVEPPLANSRTPRKSMRAKTEVIDDVPMEGFTSPDTPRRSPRLAKKALESKPNTIGRRTWTAKCSQTPSREASPIPPRLRARSKTPASPSPVPKAASPLPKSQHARNESEAAAAPAPLTCKQDRTHIVRVHGSANVGKSSIIRSARSLDLPRDKADAGISARTWSKEGLFTNLIFRDTDVTEEVWQEWSRVPLNAKYVLAEQGRTVHLVVHALNVQLSGPAALATASRLLQEDDNSLVVLMLNKTDLSADWSQAQSSKHLEETARHMIDAGIGASVMKRRLRWFAVSADNGNGIGDAFREIARELRREGPIERVAS